MELQVLGSGTAFNTDGRASQAVLVRPATAPPFLVDVGPTLISVANRLAVDLAAVDRVFITHLHGDHTAGWPFLLLQMVFQHRRTRALHVHGPVGTRECLEGLARLCYADALEHRGFAVVHDEIPVAQARGLGGAEGAPSFDVLPMQHHPTSIGYRFDVDGTRLGITGDTAWCDNVERLAQECDVLILECTSLAEPIWAHVSLAEVRARIDRLGRGQVLLVHLPDEVALDLARDPLPRVLATYDGFVFGA